MFINAQRHQMGHSFYVEISHLALQQLYDVGQPAKFDEWLCPNHWVCQTSTTFAFAFEVHFCKCKWGEDP